MHRLAPWAWRLRFLRLVRGPTLPDRGGARSDHGFDGAIIALYALPRTIPSCWCGHRAGVDAFGYRPLPAISKGEPRMTDIVKRGVINTGSLFLLLGEIGVIRMSRALRIQVTTKA